MLKKRKKKKQMFSSIDSVKYKCNIDSLPGKAALPSAALYVLQNASIFLRRHFCFILLITLSLYLKQ